MGLIKGGFLRLLQTFLYLINFCCAAIVLGFYSYFLAVQSDRSQFIPTYEKAIEGLAGAAVLYTIFAVVLTCCLGGIAFFSFLGLVLDILFAGAFIAIAIMARDGASSCTGYVNTPLGYGPASDGALGFNSGNGNNVVTYAVSYRTACKYNTAVFAVSIVAIIFFIITAFLQIGLVRSHKKEKRFGPGPSNGYTEGTPKRSFWNRKSRKNNNLEKDAELGGAGTAVGAGLAAPHHNNNIRPSHDTGYTGTTTAGSALGHDKTETAPVTGTHGGYYTQPQGTGVNPYGYENTAAPHTTTGTNY